MGWEGRKRTGGWEGGERGEDVEGPGKWSAPGPVLALGGPACTQNCNTKYVANEGWIFRLAYCLLYAFD